MSESARPILRAETVADIDAVRAVNEAAFPTPLEAKLVDALRVEADGCISIVAATGGQVVGHILLSPMTMDEAPTLRVVALGPMAVAPPQQRRGLGSALVRAAIERARELDVDVIVVLGHPDFYPRFGFEPASEWGVRCAYEAPDEAFMLLELRRGAIAMASPDLSSRTVRYHPAFGPAFGRLIPVDGTAMSTALRRTRVDLRCIDCGYPLEKAPPSGRCPECGRPVADSRTALERWPEVRRRKLHVVVGALGVATGAQLIVVGALLLTLVAEFAPTGVNWMRSDLFGCVALVAIPSHLIACWGAGESALAAGASLESQPAKRQWRWLARVLPPTALVLIAVSGATFEPALIALTAFVVVTARAATIATALDVLAEAGADLQWRGRRAARGGVVGSVVEASMWWFVIASVLLEFGEAAIAWLVFAALTTIAVSGFCAVAWLGSLRGLRPLRSRAGA